MIACPLVKGEVRISKADTEKLIVMKTIIKHKLIFIFLALKHTDSIRMFLNVERKFKRHNYTPHTGSMWCVNNLNNSIYTTIKPPFK